jgi:DNA helicase-2/ATP-dependent DNA helicase PcrA
MGRLENLNALLDGISTFVEEGSNIDPDTASPDTSLAAYLQNIALLTDLDNESESPDFVTLMSVHAAKGLEFKSVFIVGMEEKLFPSFMSMDTIEALDEERRLFYVAITRAEQFLTLSYATSRYRYGQMRYNEPSRFLEEVPKGHMESTAYVRSRPSDGPEPKVIQPKKSGVQGNFQRQSAGLKIDPKDFKPSPSSEIQPGMKVLHLKFGEGKVLSIDGGANNRIATIFFQEVDNPQRRIMLKFAKLQILD